MAATCFGLRPSSGSWQLSLAKVILILKHSVRLRRNLLCGGVAACPGMACVLCAVQSTYFGLRPSSGSLQLSLAKVILILKHTVRLRRNLLCCGVAACPGMACVLCAVLRNLTECFNINITLAMLNCKLTDDGRRPKHVVAI